MPIMSFAEYARKRKCSRAYISRRKSEGVLDKAIVKKNGREKIDSKKADKILGETSDPNFTKGSRRRRQRPYRKKPRRKRRSPGPPSH